MRLSFVFSPELKSSAPLALKSSTQVQASGCAGLAGQSKTTRPRADRSPAELVTTVAGAAAAGAASSAVGNGAARQGSRIVIPDDVLPADKRRDRLGRMMDACKILLEVSAASGRAAASGIAHSQQGKRHQFRAWYTWVRRHRLWASSCSLSISWLRAFDRVANHRRSWARTFRVTGLPKRLCVWPRHCLSVPKGTRRTRGRSLGRRCLMWTLEAAWCS